MSDIEELRNITTALLVLAHTDEMQSILVEFKIIVQKIKESLRTNGVPYRDDEIKECLAKSISNFLINNVFQKDLTECGLNTKSSTGTEVK